MRDQLAPPDERRARGKALREKLPRSAHAAFALPPDRPDVIQLIEREAAGRDPELVALRWGRMALSPFACFRGAAGVFAFDLARAPHASIDVQLCGDAHCFNLGAYAAPDGHLVFDLNDFDQACRGPFEWDLKRLAASFVLAGREAEVKASGPRDAVIALVESYRRALDEYSEMRYLDVARLEIRRAEDHRPLAPIFARAMRDTSDRLLKKFSEPGPATDGGRARFRSIAPVLRPLDEHAAAPVLAALHAYRATLGAGRQQVLDAYRPLHVAARAQGVGSFGYPGWVVLCYGNGPDDPLFLQVKGIGTCVWDEWLPKAEHEHRGRRAAEAQARTQTVSDPFLGWATVETHGPHGTNVPCIVRQWSDHKASCSVEMLAGKSLGEYAELCGQILAKAHARTSDAAVLAGYCGGGGNLDEAFAELAVAYADQAERDHARVIAAIKAGTIRAIAPG